MARSSAAAGLLAPSPAYDDALQTIRQEMASADGVQEGDPVRAAAVIRTVLEDADAPLRLPLGAEAVENLTASYQRSLGEVDRWATMSRSADYPEAARSERAFLA